MSEPDPEEPAGSAVTGLRKALFLVLGVVLLALGIIGAFVPLMPTTIFLILAAWCFGRSSTRLEGWMLAHPRFGPVLGAWRAHGAIPRRAKWLACFGMAASFVLFLYGAQPHLWVAAVVMLALLACAAWIVTRPENPG